MTMSLVGPYLTTTNYKKPKQKNRTKAQQAQFEQQHREYNKRMKRMGCKSTGSPDGLPRMTSPWETLCFERWSSE